MPSNDMADSRTKVNTQRVITESTGQPLDNVFTIARGAAEARAAENARRRGVAESVGCVSSPREP